MFPRWRAGRTVRLATVVALGGLLGGWLGLGVGLLAPAPAAAHASLAGSSPANGARLDSAPAEIRLRFTERVTVAAGGFALRDTTGATVPTAAPEVPPDAPTEVRLAVPPGLGAGTWVLTWRVVSADSHPISGALVFGVGSAPVDIAAAAATPARASTALVAWFTAFRWAGYAGLALIAGALAVFVLCWPRGWSNRRARRLVAAGWATSVAGAAGSLLLQGPYAAGRGLAGVAEPALLSATLGTDYGRYLLVRLGLLLLAGALVIAGARLPGTGRSVAAAGLALALPATWIGTGHTNTAGGPLDLAAHTTHLVAMAVWFGGLGLLAACVLPRSAGLPADEVAPVLRRFSSLATCAVVAIAGTGVAIAWREVGSWEALAGTAYGRLLAFKLAVVGVLLWFGAMSRAVVRRRYATTGAATTGAATTGAATTGAPETAAAVTSRSRRRAARAAGHDERRVRAQLLGSVRLEVGAAAAVLALVAVLVTTPPGVVVSAADAAPAGPVTQRLRLAGDGTAGDSSASDGTGENGTGDDPAGVVEVRLDPGWVGDNRLDLVVRDPAGEPWDVPEMTASLTLSEPELGPLPVELTRTGPGRYEATAPVPVAGTWRLRLAVRTSEIDSVTVLADLPVA